MRRWTVWETCRRVSTMIQAARVVLAALARQVLSFPRRAKGCLLDRTGKISPFAFLISWDTKQFFAASKGEGGGSQAVDFGTLDSFLQAEMTRQRY